MFKVLKAGLRKLGQRGKAAVKKAVAIKEPVTLPSPTMSYTGPLNVRLRAIRRALWFGLIPWWMYEDVKHHEGGWLRHASINVYYASRWILGRETDEDHEFERLVNK